MDVDVPEVPKKGGHIPDLGLDSLVQIHLGTGPAYGTIRWIGRLPDLDHTMAGIELVGHLNIDLLFLEKNNFSLSRLELVRYDQIAFSPFITPPLFYWSICPGLCSVCTNQLSLSRRKVLE